MISGSAPSARARGVMGLDGKVAWITGAGTGIGLAGAQALAQAGAVVVMSGRRAEVLEREAGPIRQAGAKAEIEPLDVSDHGRWRVWRPTSCAVTAGSTSW